MLFYLVVVCFVVIFTTETETQDQTKMTYTTSAGKTFKIKLAKVTDDRNTVTVIDNVTIVQVNKPKSHR